MKPICGLDSAHRTKVMEANSLCFLRQTDALQHVQQIPAEHLLWAPPPSLGKQRGTRWTILLSPCCLYPVVCWSWLTLAHGFCKLAVLHSHHLEIKLYELTSK